MLRPTRSRPTALLAALSGAALLTACSRAEQPALNAILITLDTTRLDALGCYGGSPLVTPHLDQLARESLVFEEARSVAPLTLPAHASMLTGLLPPRHGVHDNGIAVLPEAAVTLAERARAAGLQTAAFVASTVLDRAFALDQGFETWEQPARPERQVSSGFGEHRAQEVVAAARRWLSHRDRTRPFLVWLHFYDPHTPYDPPAAFLRQVGGNVYLGEIAAVDAAIGDFLAPLRDDGTLESSVVLVVADHGESLGEHGEPTHGAFCYDVTMRVPLLLRYPDGRRAGERSDRPASVVDVFSTLVEALGLGDAGDVDGISLWRGDPPRERGQYLESYSGWLNYGWSPLAGWVEDGTKYLHSSAPELYRIDGDPRETRDLFSPTAPEVARGTRALGEVWARARLPEPAARAFDAALLADLRSLGYGATGAPITGLASPLEASARPAPREREGELARFLQASYLTEARQHAAALELLRGIVAENPEHGMALDLLGLNLMQVDAFEEALEAFRQRLACGPERADTWLNLGICRERLGDAPGAIEALQRALSIDPGHPQVRGELASELEQAGRAEEAAALRAGSSP